MPATRIPKRYIEVRQTIKDDRRVWRVSLNWPHGYSNMATYPADQHREAMDHGASLAANHNVPLVWDGSGELAGKGN